jgi:hypothetical protein
MLAVVTAVALLSSVLLPGGASPDRRFKVVLEADRDSPNWSNYEFKGAAEEFPAVLLMRTNGVVLGRFEWLGDSYSGGLLRLRTEVKWRSDSRAVAVNTAETYYANCLVLAIDPSLNRVASIPLPAYTELSGRADPPRDRLRPRGRTVASGWTSSGRLILETWLWGDVEYPLSYRALLRLQGNRFAVEHREPILVGNPSW